MVNGREDMTMLHHNDARPDPAAGMLPPSTDASRRFVMLGGGAFLALALAGCSATNGASSSAASTESTVERRCVVMGPSGSRGKRMIRVPCEAEAAQ